MTNVVKLFREAPEEVEADHESTREDAMTEIGYRRHRHQSPPESDVDSLEWWDLDGVKPTAPRPPGWRPPGYGDDSDLPF